MMIPRLSFQLDQTLLLQVMTTRCNKCIKYRSSLCSSYANYVRPKDNSSMTASSSHTNLRYICTPQQSIRMKNRKAQVRIKTRQIKQLEERLANMMGVDEGLHGGLWDVMKTTPLDSEDVLPEGSLRQCFPQSVVPWCCATLNNKIIESIIIKLGVLSACICDKQNWQDNNIVLLILLQASKDRI